MPATEEQLAEIEALKTRLNAAIVSESSDGQSTTTDLKVLRRQLVELEIEAGLRRRRPLSTTVDLG